MRERKSVMKRLSAAALALVLTVCCAVITVQAAPSSGGLVVEKMTFRDVLRLYSADRESFGDNALTTDASGVSNAARRLASLFAYTVGLNYTGIGSNSDYYGKDITGRMGSEPYTEDNLLATYEVEIRPFNAGAEALPEGSTTAIRVYRVDYTNAVNGVEPVLHYVWQDVYGTWYAVKDDNPYYKVSYNGMSALELRAANASELMYCRANGGGTAELGEWSALASAAVEDGVVHLKGVSVVVGQGTANLFGVTAQPGVLIQRGGLAECLSAVSDFVQGDATWQTGPLVYSRQCMREDNMHMVPDGEALEAGVSYRFRVVYDEALTVASGKSRNDVKLTVRGETSGNILPVSDFCWYGAQEYLSGDKYNPHTVEFTFTPNSTELGVCSVNLEAVQGASSALAAAPFHICLKTGHIELTAEERAAASENGSALQIVPVLGSADAASPVTRLMLAECLWELAGKPQGDMQADAFTDMPSDPEGKLAVLWASRSGLIVGYGDGSFGSANAVTREQAALILSRYAAMHGLTIDGSGDIYWYWDGHTVSSWARDAVMWALKNSILITPVEGYICPADNAKCGDMVNMLTKLMQMY